MTEYLFKLFKRRSLFPAAEHLALAILANTGCTADAKREALFEQYRKMAKGNMAPDILLLHSNKPYKKLSDIKSNSGCVFDAGWCPTCNEEAPKLKTAYQGWKKMHGLEIVYIFAGYQTQRPIFITSSFP